MANSVAAEGNGIVYLTGYTGSTNFPVLGEYQGDQGGSDAFLTKLDTTQSGAASLLYSTYLGGSSNDQAWSVAAEGNGVVYLAGGTYSTNFPLLGQYQGDQGDQDGFLTKLDTTQTGAASLLYSTYLGGGGSVDEVSAVTAEGNGIAYVAGLTNSTNFPVLGQFQTDQPSYDGFLTKLDTTQTGAASLLYSTYLGGDSYDQALSVAAEGSGIVYVAGWTESPDFPLLGQFQEHQGQGDGFLTKLNTTQNGTASLLYSTCLGGSRTEQTESVAAEGDGIVYLGGWTASPDFPLLGQFQGDQGDFDGFLTTLDTTRTGAASLLDSTYLGGNNFDYASSVAADGNGIVYVAGSTLSTNFPLLRNFQANQPEMDGFLTAFRVDTPRYSLVAQPLSPTQVQLDWIDPSASETGFKIEAKVTASGAFVQVDTVGATAGTGAPRTYICTDLGPNTRYTFRVRPYTGIVNGRYSQEAEALTPAAAAPAPSNLQVKAYEGPFIRLIWTDRAPNEQGFAIERSTDGLHFTFLTSTGPRYGVGSYLTYEDRALTLGAKYHYRVRAVINGGSTEPTNVASAVAQNAPAAPTGLTAVGVQPGQIRIAWTDQASNESGFVIDWSEDGVQFTRLAGATGSPGVGGQKSYILRGLVVGKRYWYRVAAWNQAGFSAYSNLASAVAPGG